MGKANTSIEQMSSQTKTVSEGVGFEPTVAHATLVFKTNTIDHSDTLPEIGILPKLTGYRLTILLGTNRSLNSL